jgi:cytochrome c oxidase subunit 4
MSSETLAHEVTDAAPEEHAQGHVHPGDKQYIVVALILGVFTAIEVLTYFFDFAGAAIPTLIVLMIIKFAMVAAYFMHLKFDSRLFFAQGKPKTRMQTGLAHLFEFEAQEKPIRLSVSMPGRNLHETFQVTPSLTPQVGLSLDETGKLKVNTSVEPFGYV